MPAEQNATKSASPRRSPRTRRQAPTATRLLRQKKSGRSKPELQRSNELLERRVRERTRELRMTNAQLESEIQRRKGLEGEILSVSDREQQRLGQELHDGLCQHLTAVAFMTRSIALRLKDHRVINVEDLENISQLINDSVISA